MTATGMTRDLQATVGNEVGQTAQLRETWDTDSHRLVARATQWSLAIHMARNARSWNVNFNVSY